MADTGKNMEAVNGDQSKTKAQLKAERKAMHEANMVQQIKPKEAVNKSKAELKAERRALQESQRMAKETAKATQNSKKNNNKPSNQLSNQTPKEPSDETSNQPTSNQSNQKSKQTSNQTPTSSSNPSKKPFSHHKRMPSTSFKESFFESTSQRKVHFFKHLWVCKSFDTADISQMKFTHTSLQNKLTSDDRVIGLAKAIEELLLDYQTPAKKSLLRDFPNVLQKHLNHLHKTRPMCTASKNFKSHFGRYVTHINTTTLNKTDAECKEVLLKYLDEYINANIHNAGVEMEEDLMSRIQDGDVLIVFSFSWLLLNALMASKRKGTRFEVIVVDARPKLCGTLMAERLNQEGIRTTYTYVSSAPFYIRQASKVVIEAESVFSNGSVLAVVGASLLCLHASLHVLPVLVLCQSYKLSENCHTDSIVCNELGEPDELSYVPHNHDTQLHKKHPPLRLNVIYDVIPHNLVDLVITEKGTLPSSSISGILRVKWGETYP